ncbi:MAG: accessory gene regulator B family protein [Lachnospiraceae bacterium]|nr:accessory gene regulator B family protein [Lachnospiraceae bacterium]
MKDFLKKNYNFTDYQIAQLGYLFKTLLGELSKMVIMGVLFRKELPLYFAAIIMLLLMRTSTGGLHCKTYFTCLLSSCAYIFVCIKLLPMIPLPIVVQIISLPICLYINYKWGPVTSDIHMPLTEEQKKRGRIRALLIIYIFAIVMSIIPDNKYLIVCYWVIIVHSLQLVYAKILKKGVQK